MIKFFVNNQEIEANIGDNLLEVILKNGIKIRSNCEGNGACGTCQVKLDDEHYSKMHIKNEEFDILDRQINLTPTSRLSCQVIVSEDLNGANITVI